MTETAKLRKLIIKRGTLEILIPLCCTTNLVRYMKFRHTLKCISIKMLVIEFKEPDGDSLKRQAYRAIPQTEIFSVNYLLGVENFEVAVRIRLIVIVENNGFLEVKMILLICSKEQYHQHWVT